MRKIHPELLANLKSLHAMLETNATMHHAGEETELTDGQYDQLCVHIRRLVKQHGLDRKEFPLAFDMHVGSELGIRHGDVKHVKKLYTLEKAYEVSEVRSFLKKAVKILRSCGISQDQDLCFDMIAEYKLDGHAIELVYCYGKLCSASTRGNGILGKDMTSKIFSVPNIPTTLGTNEQNWKNLPLVAIAGELYADDEGYRNWSNDLNCPCDKIPADARSMISSFRSESQTGIEKHLKFNPHEITQIRHLDCYDYGDLQIHDRASDRLKLLLQWGFERVTAIKTINGDIPNQCENLLQEIADKRSSLGFPIDGIVVSYDSMGIRNVLDYTQSFPRWAFALKFPAEDHRVTVLGVDWNVAMGGDLKPVLIHSSIGLGGRVFKQVTLHNYSYFKSLGTMFKGHLATIAIKGDVTPVFTGLVPYDGTKSADLRISPPVICPSCTTPLIVKSSSLSCPSTNCPDQISKRMAYYSGSKYADIKGFDILVFKHLSSQVGAKDIGRFYALYRESGSPDLAPKGICGKTWPRLFRELDQSLQREFKLLFAGTTYGCLKQSEISIITDEYDSFGELHEAISNNQFPKQLGDVSTRQWLTNHLELFRLIQDAADTRRLGFCRRE